LLSFLIAVTDSIVILPMLKFRVHILKPEWTDVPVQGICCQMWSIQRQDNWDPDVLIPKLAECLFHPPLLAKIKVIIVNFLHDTGRMK
jgi:hypothetical protein